MEDKKDKMPGFKLDAHIHSIYSGDKYLRGCTISKIIYEAFNCGLGGLDGIVVTDIEIDCFFDKLCLRPKKYLEHLESFELLEHNNEIASIWDKKGHMVRVLRGTEHHDDKGHLLVIGGEKQIRYNPNDSLLDRINEAHDNNRIIGPAHPYETAFGGLGGDKLEELHDKFDFIEIFNSLANPRSNELALDASMKYGIPGLSNSDDHNASPGRAYTILDVSKDFGINPNEDLNKLADNIKTSIKTGKIKGHYQSYTGLLEKIWLFAGKEILHGNFSALPDRIKRYYDQKKING